MAAESGLCGSGVMAKSATQLLADIVCGHRAMIVIIFVWLAALTVAVVYIGSR